MAERTPKPSTVRSGWIKGHPFPLTTEPEEREAEFDRMIAAVEAAVRADQIEKDAAIAEKAADESPYDFQDHSAEIIAAIRAQLTEGNDDE